MSKEIIIKCSVNGVLDGGYYKGRPISAMCGKVKCSTSECSLPKGECELQEVKKCDS